MNITLSFASGALVGDALMHLLPKVFGVHNHAEEPADAHAAHGGAEHEETIGEMMDKFLGPGLVVAISILGFFLVRVTCSCEVVNARERVESQRRGPFGCNSRSRRRRSSLSTRAVTLTLTFP